MGRRLSHVVGFDDAPFLPRHRGDVLVVGAVYTGLRLEGVLSGKVRRDGANATRVLSHLIEGSRFGPHIQVVLLQGIAFGGFNVIDLHRLHATLGRPVIAVARKPPDMDAIRRALLEHVPGGARKWALLEGLGPMEPVANVFVQRAGISLEAAGSLIARLAVSSVLPEPLRTAHLIAGGIALGESRHRA
ncbi:MAG: DUF99 family protein [Gammaproteobacteria bacterium]|nr:DUF99 family protein [Gammaproteobacteria bacterium]NIR83653.1 DUF99 family protein [Gammaproteobacteria bacterium]NIR91628.1 DUF99 family protein [Gammaproteobacteria bacterium]NIU04815.1 DUF99 family protein [Gammaproteobacteria bacterium]NIV51801.1 DUF99 family protein [Gammaproteobacteria bacterium]